MSQSLTLDVKGLYTYSSDVAGVPPGTLAIADNVNITRVNILEPRRGFEYQYNGANVLTFGSSGDRVKKFVFWKESNYIHFASTFALFSGSGVSSRGSLVTPTNATSVRDVSFSNKNLYLTNSTGLLKTDAVATSLYSAGIPKGLAISVESAGAGTAVAASKYVSYRYLIGRKDANGNTVLGAPSGRVTFQNTSTTSTVNVNVVCEIPDGLDSSHFIQVYRSAESTTSDTSDEMYLVYERFLTSTTSSKNISQISRAKVYDDVYQVEVVTSAAHGFVSGQYITVTATTNTGINGSYYITRFSDTIFNYTQIGSLSVISLTSDTGTAVYPGDFNAQVAAILDSTPSDLTGSTIYTAPSQEGAVNENNEPPIASDIAEYQNLMWYADTQSKQRITLSLISAVPLIGTQVTIGSETYTFRSFSNYKEHIVNAPTYKVMLSTVAKAGNVVTVVTAVAHELQVGETINFQPSNDPTNLAGTSRTIATVPSSTSFTLSISAGSNISPAAADTGYLTHNSTVATTSALAINQMAESLIRNINLNPDGAYYAYSASSADDTYPGRIIIEARSYSQAQFSVTSTQPTYWQPQLVSPAQNDNKSQNDAFRNGLMYSKADQPEAVPYKNIFRVGSADDPILRIWAARDALFVFKKRDGLWIIRGETEANFTKNQLDVTAKLFAPDSLTSVNNNLYALMEAGICEISDTGVNVISFPIRDQLFQNFTAYATNTQNYAFGVGNDIDGKYILSLPTSSTNSYCEKQIVYDVYSKIFCGNWSIETTAGRLNPIDAKMYFGPTANKIKKELRTFTATDFVDEYQTLSITAVDATGLILTLSSVLGLSVNDVIKQGSTYVYLLAINNTNNTVTVDMKETWTTGVANVVHYKALDVKVEWNSEFAGNPAGFKHFYEMSLLQKSSFLISSTFYFRNDINAAENYISITAPSYSGNWGDFTWGEEVWGGDPTSNTPVRLGVPRTHARCSQLRVRWEHKVAYSDFQVQGISLAYNQTSTRITNNAAQ